MYAQNLYSSYVQMIQTKRSARPLFAITAAHVTTTMEITHVIASAFTLENGVNVGLTVANVNENGRNLDIDFCMSSPCAHGECKPKLQNLESSYNCTCDKGWTGVYCDIGRYSRFMRKWETYLWNYRHQRMLAESLPELWSVQPGIVFLFSQVKCGSNAVFSNEYKCGSMKFPKNEVAAKSRKPLLLLQKVI